MFNIFTFKKDAAKVFTAENFQYVLGVAKDAIIGEIKANVPGQEKKNVVDAVVLSKIDAVLIKTNTKNKLVLWVINRIKEGIPTVTQLVYDFLKAKIENL